MKFGVWGRAHKNYADLALARRAEGATVFDWVVEIIRIHGVGGE